MKASRGRAGNKIEWLRSTDFLGWRVARQGTLLQSGVFMQAAAGAACNFIFANHAIGICTATSLLPGCSKKK
jgi:hypothetical protein